MGAMYTCASHELVMLMAGPLGEASGKVKGAQRVFHATAMVMGTSKPVRKNKNRGVGAYGEYVTVTYGISAQTLFKQTLAAKDLQMFYNHILFPTRIRLPLE